MKLPKLKYKKELGQLVMFAIKTLIIASVAIGVLVFATYQYIEAERKDNPNVRTIRVQGYANNDTSPDVFSITIGVDLSGSDPIALNNEASDKVNKIIEDLKELEISEDNIKTTKFELSTDNESDGKINFEVYLNVTINDLMKADKRPAQIIQASFENGLNKISSINYSLNNIDDLREELKSEAIEDANKRKDALEEQTGIKLGRILDVSFTSNSGKYLYRDNNYNLNTSADKNQVQEITIQAGSEEVSESVTIEYEVL